MRFPPYYGNVSDPHVLREHQICRMGWVLLFAWLAMILWMTRSVVPFLGCFCSVSVFKRHFREIWYDGEERNPDLFPQMKQIDSDERASLKSALKTLSSIESELTDT